MNLLCGTSLSSKQWFNQTVRIAIDSFHGFDPVSADLSQLSFHLLRQLSHELQEQAHNCLLDDNLNILCSVFLCGGLSCLFSVIITASCERFVSATRGEQFGSAPCVLAITQKV